MKVWVDMAVGDPPLQGVFHLFNRFAKVLLELASPRSDMLGYGDVCKGSKLVILIVLNL
jgi:hypothetical protein